MFCKDCANDKHLFLDQFKMAEESHISEDAKLLQAKLGDLDVETLQQLLQTAIANKTKEPNQQDSSPGTTSVGVDQTATNGTTENNDEVKNNETADGGGAEIPGNVRVIMAHT
jgi:hypothetical protein